MPVGTTTAAKGPEEAFSDNVYEPREMGLELHIYIVMELAFWHI